MKKYILIILFSGIIVACRKDVEKSVDCSGPQKSFATDITPIFRSSCATDSDCHGSGSTSGPGPLMNYTQDYNAKVLIRSAVLSGEMPQDKKLSSAEKGAIICWIDSGAPNN